MNTTEFKDQLWRYIIRNCQGDEITARELERLYEGALIGMRFNYHIAMRIAQDKQLSIDAASLCDRPPFTNN